MLLLGLLSVIQTTIIPGYILIDAIQLNVKTFIQKWIYIFAFSLFINYLLVTILTLFGIYLPNVVFSIILIEIVYIFYITINKKRRGASYLTFKDLFVDYISIVKSQSSINKFLLIAVSLIVIFYFSLIMANLGKVFYFIDTVNNIHWNTWAKDFANNHLPQYSGHFPQLIPANWSLSYLITHENSVDFFPKAIMPLFFFSNVLIFLDLAISEKRNIYLTALIIYGLISPIIYSLVFIADGNADLPVSFFAFLSFYSYLKADKNKLIIKEYILVFLFASTAAGTKLAGFYIFAFMSIILLYHLIRNWRLIKKHELFFILITVITVICTNMFWYLLKPEVMYGGLNQPEYLREGYYYIIQHALNIIYYNLGVPLVVFLLLTISFSFFNKEVRHITLFLVFPSLMIWIIKFSVDLRNLSFVVPFISYVSAFGLYGIIKMVSGKSMNSNLISFISDKENINHKKTMLAVAVSLMCIGLFFVIQSNFIYRIMLKTYEFFGIYYFQSYKINLLVDYTPFIHVNYYQNVIAIMFLFFSTVCVLNIFNIKIRHFIILLCLLAVFLNFTYIKRDEIINHQKNQVERIDARNYYYFINSMIKGTELSKYVYTNFETIHLEPIPKEINFMYIRNADLHKLLIADTSRHLIFLKVNSLATGIKDMIDSNLVHKKYKLFFNDGDYIFFGLR